MPEVKQAPMSCDIMIIPVPGVSHIRPNPWCPGITNWISTWQTLVVCGSSGEKAKAGRGCTTCLDNWAVQLWVPAVTTSFKYCQSEATGRHPGTLDVCFPHNILSPWRDINTMKGMKKTRQSWRGGDAFEGAGSLPWNLMTSDKWLTRAVFLLPSPHSTDFAVYIVFLELVIFVLCTVMVMPQTLAFVLHPAILATSGVQCFWHFPFLLWFSFCLAGFHCLVISSRKAHGCSPSLCPHLGDHVPWMVRLEYWSGCMWLHYVCISS